MRIDFIADVVCPWCYLGWRRLQKALDLRPDVEAQVYWRPFMLDPSLPETGVDRREYMAKKFRDPERAKAIGEALAQAAAEDGIVMRLSEIPISPNTGAAHRLIRWAQRTGRQDAVLEGVLKAYFTDLRDIGDPEVLAEIGEAAGLEKLMLLQLLASDEDRDTIANEHNIATRAGVTGVPFMIFDNKTAVAGAETPEAIAAAIDQALAS